MIIITTGNGKGKTTSAIGQIIRALGHNHKVCLIQLFKGDMFYGEQNILSKFSNLDFFSFAKEHPFLIKTKPINETKKECENALKKLKEILSLKRKYDLIVLEEFNIALRDNFIDLKEFLDLIKELNKMSDIFITGRKAPQDLIDIADLVTKMEEVKHPYSKGIPAKKGIEF